MFAACIIRGMRQAQCCDEYVSNYRTRTAMCRSITSCHGPSFTAGDGPGRFGDRQGGKSLRVWYVAIWTRLLCVAAAYSTYTHVSSQLFIPSWPTSTCTVQAPLHPSTLQSLSACLPLLLSPFLLPSPSSRPFLTSSPTDTTAAPPGTGARGMQHSTCPPTRPSPSPSHKTTSAHTRPPRAARPLPPTR